jgi:hypothetical protein
MRSHISVDRATTYCFSNSFVFKTRLTRKATAASESGNGIRHKLPQVTVAVRDHPDSGHPRQVWRHSHPVVANGGQHRRCSRDLVSDDGRRRNGARADFLGRAARSKSLPVATDLLESLVYTLDGFTIWL